jgi:hypothetical protein
MGVRGRKSAASLSVAVTNIPGQRPEPPEKLSEAQKQEWRAVVARMPPDWFTRENQALLVEHCRHVERSDVLDAELRSAVEAGRSKDLPGLMTLAKQETSILATLATKMRLSQASRWDHQKSATAVRHETNGTRPWQRSA